MNKLKEIFTWLKNNIVLVLTGIIAALVYVINLNNKKHNALLAQLDLIKTQKEADILEVEIKTKLEQKDLSSKEMETLNKGLVELQNKRAELTQKETSKNDKEIADYWNKE